jgi:ring-1,2-phenylacetyl-CoA epoxidase subunit PaaB
VTDTQLRRYEIFVIERPGRPPVHAGSVHASDGELALLNARDVFARRPDCHGLWALPAEAITSSPALTSEPPASVAPMQESYLVFGKPGHKGVQTFLGVVQAASAAEALDAGRKTLGGGIVDWWVAPERYRLATQPEDAAPMFDPSKDKPFRDQAYYPVETMMRKLRRERESGREKP